jgi:hypothetical protein
MTAMFVSDLTDGIAGTRGEGRVERVLRADAPAATGAPITVHTPVRSVIPPPGRQPSRLRPGDPPAATTSSAP